MACRQFCARGSSHVRIWNFESRLKTDSAEFSSTGTEGVLLEAVLISFLMLERVNGMQAILCAGHFFVFFGKFNGGRSASARFGGAVCHVPPRSLSRNRPVARNAVRCSLFRIESVARRLHRGNDQARRLPLADRIEQRDFVALIMLLKAREGCLWWRVECARFSANFARCLVQSLQKFDPLCSTYTRGETRRHRLTRSYTLFSSSVHGSEGTPETRFSDAGASSNCFRSIFFRC